MTSGDGLDPFSSDVAGARSDGLRASPTTLRQSTQAGSPSAGWRSFVPPNRSGRFPWRWRWLGVPLLLAACTLTGIWAWGSAERSLGESALVHLACEDVDTTSMNFDWSYRSVTVDGQLPLGVSAESVERIIMDGSTNTNCLESNNIDVNRGTGVVAATAALALAAPAPAPTATPIPEPTATPVPEPTPTPAPSATAEPEPTAVPTATAVPVVAPISAAAAFDGTAITLSGLIGTEAERSELVAAAIAAVGRDNVTDNLEIADGSPSEASGQRITELASLLSVLSDPDVVRGAASIDDSGLSYQLFTTNEAAANRIDLPGNGVVEVLRQAQLSFTG